MTASTELGQHIETFAVSGLGKVSENSDIKSSMAPFQLLVGYKIKYPPVIIRALERLYIEYNQVFLALVDANREWPKDYQYCMKNGKPINIAIQIDMVGLPEAFLETASCFDESDIVEALRKRVYEIENSMAMYQLLQNLFANGDHDTSFKKGFRKALDDLRERHGKKIALLAVTDEKYQAMKETEFGVMNGGVIIDEIVKTLSGFDRLFSPDQFKQHMEDNDDKCQYLLYARTSDPVAKLRKPGVKVAHPLLDNPELRKVIKENAITFNIDGPEQAPSAIINDTKEYMMPMDMAFSIKDDSDLLSSKLVAHLSSGKSCDEFVGGKFFSEGFESYLRSQGVDHKDVESGKVNLRAKPMKCAYGCYGHLTGPLTKGKFRRELRRNLRQRGSYVIQTEMSAPVVTNKEDGETYTFIDRVFFTFTDERPQFLGGFRALMPLDSKECKRGRNHGNHATVWGEIIA